MNILDIFDPNAVCLHIDAKDAKEVIVHLGDLLYRAGYVRESFADAALEREKQLPTGLPLSGKFNAAIPHTDIQHVIRPGLGMATLSKPVVFMNMISPEDPVEVQLVFILALDQPKSQIEMLQQIAGVLQNPLVVEALMASESFEQVCKALA